MRPGRVRLKRVPGATSLIRRHVSTKSGPEPRRAAPGQNTPQARRTARWRRRGERRGEGARVVMVGRKDAHLRSRGSRAFGNPRLARLFRAAPTGTRQPRSRLVFSLSFHHHHHHHTLSLSPSLPLFCRFPLTLDAPVSGRACARSSRISEDSVHLLLELERVDARFGRRSPPVPRKHLARIQNSPV
ncbi:hypothetical protein PENSPDRAFT_45259 [Peniophora sp. CONT]|nr:hypothetical protein PENSPDRAFT_45259 [Peniophora sp. CONT]